MPSPKLERAKSQLRGASNLLVLMADYVRHQFAANEEYVTPKLAAASLHLNEGEAFVLLKLMEAAGVLRQQFNVYCRPKDMFIQSVDSLDDLDKVAYCEFCDKQHEACELYVEVSFRLAENMGVSDLAA